MTDLIPLDAAIGALEERRDHYRQDSQTWLQIQMDVQTIRAIPTIDPAAIREAALREAAYVAINACLVPPDGGSPTEAESLVCEEAYRRILALIGKANSMIGENK